jgi:hypothetical protein
MLAVYTTNTIGGSQAVGEGAGVEPARPHEGSAGFQPAPVAKSGGPSEVISSPGWTRTTDLPHVTGTSCLLNDGTVKHPDQESNPDRLGRDEA